MNPANKGKSTVTKRDLATRVRYALKPEVKLQQAQVAEVITHTLDAIRDALINGDTVELRNFGVFKIEVRKERVGRNPKNPGLNVVVGVSNFLFVVVHKPLQMVDLLFVHQMLQNLSP